MKIPGFIKPLMTTMRPAMPGEEPMLEREGQTQQRLSKQIQNDRQRTLVRNNREIVRAKGMLSRVADPHLQKQLRQRIDKLTTENKETERFL